MGVYTPYHMHTMKSLLDSTTSFEEYLEAAIKCGMHAIGISEHGIPREWAANKLLCKAKIDSINAERAKEGLALLPPMKYLNGVEIYLTENLAPKVRDNYHTVLIAKNEEGQREMLNLVQLSTREDHMYYNNRITFDEFLDISDNVIKISACIAGPLSKLSVDHPRYMELVEHYDYLEIQHHNTPEQIAYNRLLYQLSCQFDKPLIAGTDTHSLNKYKHECRAILMEYKKQHYPDEDKFDLIWKTYDELVEAYRIQAALSEDVYMQAIENTNVMAASVEDIPIDTSIKYPILYGTRENDARRFEEVVAQSFESGCSNGMIKPHQIEAFKKAIDEEMAVFKKLDMTGFMLSMHELLKWCRENNIPVGPGRGSVTGSRIAYLVGITDLNPEDLNTNFARFANEERVEIGDIDIDCIASDDRAKIFDYIQNRFGERFTARVGSYGTLADKSIIDVVGKTLQIPYAQIKEIKKLHESDPEKARNQYPEIYYYYDGLASVTISQSVHPAGMVISPVELVSNYGTIYKDGVQCLLLGMDATHDVGLAKYDFLGLKTLAVIRDTCNMANIPFPRYNTMDWHDEVVWNELDEDSSLMFQMEKGSAKRAMRDFKPHSIKDLALVSACLRPSSASYRDKVYAHIPNKNPTEAMDKLFADSLGYLVYQEQIIQALIELCGFTGSQADSVRRDIAKKKEAKVAEDVIKIREGYCRLSSQPREIAEQECAQMLQVIQDASGYSFNYNHAAAYSLLTYIFAWLRHYYPVEFVAAFLNNADNDEDILNGTDMMKKLQIRLRMPHYGVSKDFYAADSETRTITQGIAAIKDFGPGKGDKLFAFSQRFQNIKYFSDLLIALKKSNVKLNSNCVEKLIKLDFFSPEFGNINQLLRIKQLYEKWYYRKRIAIAEVITEPYYYIFEKYGKKSEMNITITDESLLSVMHDLEEFVLDSNIYDCTILEKARYFAEIMGYNGYISGRQEDRRKLYVQDVIPLKSRKTNDLWAYLFKCQSIGSGIETTFTVRKNLYDRQPIQKGQFIYCLGEYKDKNGYWNIKQYEELV